MSFLGIGNRKKSDININKLSKQKTFAMNNKKSVKDMKLEV